MLAVVLSAVIAETVEKVVEEEEEAGKAIWGASVELLVLLVADRDDLAGLEVEEIEAFDEVVLVALF